MMGGGAAAGALIQVWVKDVTKGLGLQYSLIEFAAPPVYVSHLKAAVLAKFMWQGVREDAISLFLVPTEEGKDEPDADEEARAIAATPLKSTRSLAAANVTSGCFVLARCAGGAVAGTGGDASKPGLQLIALRQAILDAEQKGHFIHLGDGAEWPQLGAVPLFERYFYDGCYTGPLNSLSADKNIKHRKFVILGNPGIGKSAFASYLLFRAIREGRTVVYQSAKVRKVLVFEGSGRAYTVRKKNVEDLDLLDEFSTVFISDSITPPCVHAFTVLITSPNRERWSEFYKEPDCARLFFPVFSWKEIVALQQACFPGINGLAERYSRWGGIPRYVLAKLDDEDQMQLEAALTTPDYRLLADFLGKEELESEAAASHRLLHIKVHGEFDATLATSDTKFYRLFRTELGSSFIADKVCEALMASADNQLRGLLSLSPRPPSAAKLYGEVFERAAFKALAAGGTFRIRTLQPDGLGAESDLVLPAAALPVAGFRTVEELRQYASGATANRLLRPSSKSFCAVDFILQGKRPANATVDRSHGLILKGKRNTPFGLLPVAEALGLSEPVPFFWIVPDADFDDWKKPQRLLVKGVTETKKPSASMQYVLAVPFEVPALVAAALSGAGAAGVVLAGRKQGRKDPEAGGEEGAARHVKSRLK